VLLLLVAWSLQTAMKTVFMVVFRQNG